MLIWVIFREEVLKETIIKVTVFGGGLVMNKVEINF